MKTSAKSIHAIKGHSLIRTFFACLLMVAFSFATIPAAAGPAQNKAKKAFADWKAAQEAVAAAKAKLADAQKALQNAMTAVAKSGGKATAAQEAALAQGRAAVAAAEAALREAEKQELAARVALENEIAELPDGPLKDQLKRERNFPSLVTANGLHMVKFSTPNGQLTVNLPDDMRAGDTISGTVIAEPKGNNEAERSRNLAALSGYVVELRPPVMANRNSFVGDTGNNRVQRVNPDGSAPASGPTGAVGDTLVFVGDTANNRMQRSTDGGRTWQAFTGSASSGSSSGVGPESQTPPQALLRSMDGGRTWQVYSARATNSTTFTLRLDQGPGVMDVTLNRLAQDSRPLPGEVIATTKFEIYDYPGGYPEPKNIANSRPVIVGAPAGAGEDSRGRDFKLPTLGQQGRPIEVTGPFDGDSSNTTLKSSVQDFEKGTENVSGGFGLIRPLVESPRRAAFRNSTNVTGPIELTLNEANKETKGTYRNVGVNLTAPKTNLLKGEKTTLNVEVSGLQGIKEPVPLTLESKGVITMEGGAYQPLVIQPAQVSADGRYSTTRGVTGVQAGGWEATATVVTYSMDVKMESENCDRVMLFNSSTGDYTFNCPGCSQIYSSIEGTMIPREQFAVFSIAPIGKGTVARKGCTLTLEHNAPDRRVMATIDQCAKTGTATVEFPATKEKFTITDRNTSDNTCSSGMGGGGNMPARSPMLTPN